MYYSKRGAAGIAVPRNYSGSLFRVIDESDRTPPEPPPCEACGVCEDSPRCVPEGDGERGGLLAISRILSGISVEELLLIGLMTVIHKDDPNDPILIILLVLLMTK